MRTQKSKVFLSYSRNVCRVVACICNNGSAFSVASLNSYFIFTGSANIVINIRQIAFDADRKYQYIAVLKMNICRALFIKPERTASENSAIVRGTENNMARPIILLYLYKLTRNIKGNMIISNHPFHRV